MPVWVVENKAGEQLRITIESIEHDSSHDLGVDPGLCERRARVGKVGTCSAIVKCNN